jgi:hypothetical protein
MNSDPVLRSNTGFKRKEKWNLKDVQEKEIILPSELFKLYFYEG